MRSFFDTATQSLIWLPEYGIGHYPVDASQEPYDAEYFERYSSYDLTDMGRKLLEFRTGFVRKHFSGDVVDFGGCTGAFAKAIGGKAYDINPFAVEHLQANALFEYRLIPPIRECKFPCITFWDSLEHVNSPGHVLGIVSEWAFVSLPIFDDAEHVLRSRHFRKNEHRWYWTRKGFVAWAEKVGFSVVDHALTETTLGRDGIETFALKRVV